MENKLIQIIEAALLSASRPLSIDEIEILFGEEASRDDIKRAIKEIELQCEQRGIELKKVSSGYRLQVRQDLSSNIAKLWR